MQKPLLKPTPTIVWKPKKWNWCVSSFSPDARQAGTPILNSKLFLKIRLSFVDLQEIFLRPATKTRNHKEKNTRSPSDPLTGGFYRSGPGVNKPSSRYDRGPLPTQRLPLILFVILVYPTNDKAYGTFFLTLCHIISILRLDDISKLRDSMNSRRSENR